jgi:hypothetical protein
VCLFHPFLNKAVQNVSGSGDRSWPPAPHGHFGNVKCPRRRRIGTKRHFKEGVLATLSKFLDFADLPSR